MEQGMKEIVKKITAYQQSLIKNAADEERETPHRKPVSRQEFTLLLSGISTCRKMPGVPVHMGYEALYHCEGEENERQGREHMQRLFKVTDRETLEKACAEIYSGSGQYEQFMTFWKNAPLFDINELNPNGRNGFAYCKQLAENFYPIVQEKGFYAWDIDQRIGLCRSAVACGIISEEEFWQMTDEWVRLEQVFYHSFEEYAVSALCGAVYDMGRYGEDVGGFFRINQNIVESLLGEDGAWQRSRWYVPKEREWADLLGGNPGCIVSKRAIEEGNIGYMYRDEPAENFPDSGWRFFVGDETEEYVNDPDHAAIYGLNTICNLEPAVMAFLHAGAGRRFGKHEKGWEEE